jgi:hypothetical protein
LSILLGRTFFDTLGFFRTNDCAFCCWYSGTISSFKTIQPGEATTQRYIILILLANFFFFHIFMNSGEIITFSFSQQFGAEQFNRDLRVLTSYFSFNSKKSFKDKFSRLTQIAYLLNLEKVSFATNEN